MKSESCWMFQIEMKPADQMEAVLRQKKQLLCFCFLSFPLILCSVCLILLSHWLDYLWILTHIYYFIHRLDSCFGVFMPQPTDRRWFLNPLQQQ